MNQAPDKCPHCGAEHTGQPTWWDTYACGNHFCWKTGEWEPRTPLCEARQRIQELEAKLSKAQMALSEERWVRQRLFNGDVDADKRRLDWLAQQPSMEAFGWGWRFYHHGAGQTNIPISDLREAIDKAMGTMKLKERKKHGEQP